MLTIPKEPKIRVGLLSLGCPKTLVDSEVILGKLNLQRFTVASSVADCDIAMVNTCAFIHDAQEESIDQILRLIELKREGLIRKLVVMGCLIQRFPADLRRQFKEVDAFLGSGEYAKVPEVLDQVMGGERPFVVGVPGYLHTSFEGRVPLTPNYSRYLKISEGCDHDCSFCAIPTFRGRHRSRPLEDVLREAETLVSEGARELILTGQDTTFYGYDRQGRYLLPELLGELNRISKLGWIRILYAYPSLVTDALIEAIAALPKVCHYLDMPLQHISDRVLKSMRRGVTQTSIRRLIERLRQTLPDLAIRTTFIVGYPGETERNFQELLDFMKDARFERLGIFTYSPEPGSLAAQLPCQVPQKVKHERLDAGMRLQQTISEENNRRWIGKDLEALIEEPCEDEDDIWIGRTYMDAPEVDGTVRVKVLNAERFEVGAFVRVKITETHEYDLAGQLVDPDHA